jgi:hypothetical protein
VIGAAAAALTHGTERILAATVAVEIRHRAVQAGETYRAVAAWAGDLDDVPCFVREFLHYRVDAELALSAEAVRLVVDGRCHISSIVHGARQRKRLSGFSRNPCVGLVIY